MLVPAADGDEAAFVPTDRFATAVDLRIALMVQNMAVFGAAGGESEFRSRDRKTPRFDYFA